MKGLAPGWAIGSLAIHTLGDAQLAGGVHYRVLTDARLGLPMRPVSLARQRLGRFAEDASSRLPLFPALRSDIAWTDRFGRVLLPPFEVTDSQPVIGRLPVGPLSRCVWVKVDAAAAGQDLRVDAFRTTARGARSLGARDEPPYALGASEINGVVLTGSGVVRGFTWLDYVRLVTYPDAVHELSLPRGRMARYKGQEGVNDRQAARDRVARGAPLRAGLHDEPSAAGPESTTAVSSVEELARLDALTPDLDEALDALLDDVSAGQYAMERSEPLTAGVPPSEESSAAWKPIHLIHAAMADPMLARWLGFMDREEPSSYSVDADEVVLLMLSSWWAIDPATFGRLEALSFLQALPGLLTPTTPAESGAPAWNESPDGLPIYGLLVPTAVTGHAPPLPPAPLAIDPELAPRMPATPDGLGPWVPSEPPAARRSVALRVRGLVPAAGLAFAVDAGDGFAGLNPRRPVSGGALADRAQLLVPTVPADALGPDEGRVFHREVPPEGATFRVAHADVFGRWGEWSEHTVAAKTRPAPPAPVFDAWYVKADPASATDPDDPHWGALTVRVQVPAPGERAPGSLLLDRLRLSGTIDGEPFEIEADAPDPQSGELVVDVPPPGGHGSPQVIGPGQTVAAVMTARWIDTAAVESDESQPRHLVLADARRPLPVSMPPVLNYSARPDAAGRARVKLAWTVSPGQAQFRIYYSDESRLMKEVARMRDEGAAGYSEFIAAIEAAADVAARAQAFRDHHTLLERDWFENAAGQPVLASGASAASFQHDLSGSLGVLAFYKVVAETASGTPADFVTSPLSAWAVPERSGPPRPLLDLVEIVTGDKPIARLEVRLTGRADAAARYRLRRSSAQSTDPLRMAVASEGAIALAEGAKAFEVTDDGTLVHDAALELRPFTQYYWRVEVQSPTLAGSTMPGAWSEASAAVSSMVVPLPPAPATRLLLTIAGDTARLRWRHPDALLNGALGGYRFDVYRAVPGFGTLLVTSVPADTVTEALRRTGRARWALSDTLPSEQLQDGQPPPGSVWSVVVVDPLGRSSPAAQVAAP